MNKAKKKRKMSIIVLLAVRNMRILIQWTNEIVNCRGVLFNVKDSIDAYGLGYNLFLQISDYLFSLCKLVKYINFLFHNFFGVKSWICIFLSCFIPSRKLYQRKFDLQLLLRFLVLVCRWLLTSTQNQIMYLYWL